MPREQIGIPRRQDDQELMEWEYVDMRKRDEKIESLTQCEGGSILTKARKHEK